MPPKRLSRGSAARGRGTKRRRNEDVTTPDVQQSDETGESVGVQIGSNAQDSMSMNVSFRPPVDIPSMPFDHVWQAEPVTSVFDSVGGNIPLKIKEKIWEGQFLDFGILLKSSREIQSYVDSGPPGEFSFKDGQLRLSHRKPEICKLSISEWSTAFITFLSIFLEKYPGRAQEMLKYFRDIRLAATRTNYWWKYDEQFRMQKANNPNSSWGVINLEFWLLYVNSNYSGSHTTKDRPQFQNPRSFSKSFNNPSQTQATGQPSATTSRLTCNYYNTGTNCPFSQIAGSSIHTSLVGANTQNQTAESVDARPIQLYAQGNTPLNINKLCTKLKLYPDKHNSQELINGLSTGFKLHYTGPRLPRDSPNLISAKQSPEIVSQKISKELQAGRIAGPFNQRPFPTLKVSPIGLVPKKDSGFRLIHHLSYPNEGSINYFIDEKHCSVTYSNIDQAGLMINKLGRGSLLSKSDIKSAFRLLPISPSDFDLLGIRFQNQYYFDKMLPMGSSISCAIWEKFATFLHWSLSDTTGTTDILHYIDDFLFGEAANCKTPGYLLNKFQLMCGDFGVPLAADKTVYPTTCLVFLGVELDTIQMEMRLPADKINMLKSKITNTLNCKKVSLSNMQSLLGLLNFACRVVAPGRAFCRRLINSTIGIRKPHHMVRISKNMKADLSLWLSFLNSYNGVTVITDQAWLSNLTLNLFTDAAGGHTGGFGMYFDGQWAHGSWPSGWFEEGLTRDMTLLELFPVVAAIITWSHALTDKRVIFDVDNQAVVQVINSQTCKSNRVMNLVRHMVLTMLNNNILVKAKYIQSKANIIADALSRSQWGRFRRAAPEADLCPVEIPALVWNI